MTVLLLLIMRQAAVFRQWSSHASDEQLAVDAGADSDKYPPSWLFHQKWSAGRGKGPAPTLNGHQIEVAKVAGRVRPGWGALEVISYT